MKDGLTQAELKRLLHYDKETGIFIWRVNAGKRGRGRAGDIAGSVNKNHGYVDIKIKGKKYLAHRLACLYVEGYLPEHVMDHKFGVKDDNRWSEIRHATQYCNMQNTKINSLNKSGFPGVHWSKHAKKWHAKITARWKICRIGYYDTPLDAALARYTVEVQCDRWTCNYRSELVKAIKEAWPEFNVVEEN